MTALITTTWHFLGASASNDLPPSSLSSRIYNSINPWKKSNTTEPSSSSWSSLLTVDPSKIVSSMRTYGGLIMPHYIEKELNVLAKVASFEMSKLNVVERRLELFNLKITPNNLPSRNNPALKIGRVSIQWDSYLRPCVNVKVEQVELLVEFTNLLLTRNNWDELYDTGFPPRLLLESSDDSNSSSYMSTFVRIGRVDFGGNVVVRIQSRPLDHKALSQDIVLKFSALKELSSQIKAKSAHNKHHGQRPGCTTDELYDLTTSWFKSKLQNILQKIVFDMATSQGGALGQVQRQAEKVALGANSVVKEYASNAGRKLQNQVDERLLQFQDVIPRKHLDRISALSRNRIKHITDGSMLADVAKAFSSKQREPIGVDKETYEFPDNIMFPDW